MTRGKVVLVPFPFDDLSATKVRPAVCLTEEAGSHCHLVLAYVTSAPPAETLPSDLALAPQDPDFAATGLRAPSTLRLHRMMTVASSLVLRELGELSPRLLDDVADRLCGLFGLPLTNKQTAAQAPDAPGNPLDGGN